MCIRDSSISALIQREQPVDGVYALTGVQKRLDKKSNPYWDLVLKDRSGSVAAKIWMTRGRLVPESLDNDIFAHVVGRVEFFNGMPQVKISGVTPLTPGEIAGMDISEFLPPSPYDGRGAYGELMSLADREFTYACLLYTSVSPSISSVCSDVTPKRRSALPQGTVGKRAASTRIPSWKRLAAA